MYTTWVMSFGITLLGLGVAYWMHRLKTNLNWRPWTDGPRSDVVAKYSLPDDGIIKRTK